MPPLTARLRPNVFSHRFLQEDGGGYRLCKSCWPKAGPMAYYTRPECRWLVDNGLMIWGGGCARCCMAVVSHEGSVRALHTSPCVLMRPHVCVVHCMRTPCTLMTCHTLCCTYSCHMPYPSWWPLSLPYPSLHLLCAFPFVCFLCPCFLAAYLRRSPS